MDNSWIQPDWPAPPGVRALTTTRIHGSGHSQGSYASFNLAQHVGDAPAAVAANRALLQQQLASPTLPYWLTQVHGVNVIDVSVAPDKVEADGAMATRANRVCAVLTADCLPVFLCDRAGSRIAVLHAGWRGLGAGIIERGVQCLGGKAGDLMAWLGPAIGPQSFEVGAEVYDVFTQHDKMAASAFVKQDATHWLADIYALARLRLASLGVDDVYGGGFCTYQEQERFYSFRRDPRCGRMASLIWLAAEPD